VCPILDITETPETIDVALINRPKIKPPGTGELWIGGAFLNLGDPLTRRPAHRWCAGSLRLTLLWLSCYGLNVVRRRHVYHVAGYDTIDAGAQYQRFARGLDIFRRTWQVDAILSELERSNEPPRTRWRTTTRAVDWQVEAVHEVLAWDDIVRLDFTRTMPARLFKAALAYFDFIATGVFLRYIVASPRYAVFFLFPLFSLAMFAAAAWYLAHLLTASTGLTGIGAGLVGLSAGVAVFVVLLRWPGRGWRVQHLLDDWIFARDYIYDHRPDVDARLDCFAEMLSARSHETALDEIVIVGHSLGAMLALDVLVHTLVRDPGFGRRGPAICLLTVSATIPKFTLHPRAEHLRCKITRVVAEPSIAWAEYHARDDSISFYKFDPVALERLRGDRIDGKPIIRRVQIHDMLQPDTFARHRRNVLRLHYQSVMANDKRAPYDYYLMACGPIPFLRWTTAASGFLDFVGASGIFLDPARDWTTVAAEGLSSCSSRRLSCSTTP
jgi:pimeloyl-ACP methyl ester carboxylesterase